MGPSSKPYASENWRRGKKRSHNEKEGPRVREGGESGRSRGVAEERSLQSQNSGIPKTPFHYRTDRGEGRAELEEKP